MGPPLDGPFGGPSLPEGPPRGYTPREPPIAAYNEPSQGAPQQLNYIIPEGPPGPQPRRVGRMSLIGNRDIWIALNGEDGLFLESLGVPGPLPALDLVPLGPMPVDIGDTRGLPQPFLASDDDWIGPGHRRQQQFSNDENL